MDEGLQTATIHFAGSFPPENVIAREVKSSWIAPREVLELIEREWAAALKQPDKLLFDGELTRHESSRIEAGRLHLQLSRTSYKIFLGTNLTRPELAERYGSSILANPIGVSAALQSADGFLLLGRRNSRVAYYPGRVHPFAGSAGEADVFAAMRRELMEELQLAESDIAEIRCIGMAEDQQLRQPELIFHVKSPLTRREIEDRVDATEHSDVVAIQANRAAVEVAMTNAALTPIARAALGLSILSGDIS